MEDTFDLVKYITSKRDKGIIIWLCNIGPEKYWNKVNSGIVDQNEDIIVNRIEEMNLLVCRSQDILILREMPDRDYLDTLTELGFSIPRILVPANTDLLTPISELVLNDENLLEELRTVSSVNPEVYFVPFAVTQLQEQIAQKCGLSIIGAPSQVNAKVNDKIFSREVAEALDFPVCKGKVCHTIEEVRSEYFNLVKNEPCFERVIIKEPHGASGKGLYIIGGEDKLESRLRLLARFARGNPDIRWLAEGWYQDKTDINYQIYISPEGEVEVFAINQQLLSDTVYIGTKVSPDLGSTIIRSYMEYGEKIGKYLFGLGYSGVAGIDSIILSDSVIIPIIEINGRLNMSTYISFAKRALGDVNILSRYFSLPTASAIGYRQMCKLFDDEGILYKPGCSEGVVIFTSGTLPTRFAEESGCYLGRLYAAVVAKGWDKVDEYSCRLEKLIHNISA